eukprot:m.311870 g.311870  ORF g.311870 m.311870 type:complete len:224 (+) comp167494_c0_seq1:2-673(+)
MDLSATFVREYETPAGTLSLHQVGIGDTGCVVWDAALVLSGCVKELGRRKPGFWQNKCVIELGAGTGAVGLVAATCGASCILTDLTQFIPLIQFNIDANRAVLKGSAKAEVLEWGNVFRMPEHVDVLLMSDIVYYAESLDPLIKTVNSLCGPDTIVLMSYEERTSDCKKKIKARFFELFSRTFEWTEIGKEDQDLTYQSDDIIVLKAMQKKSLESTASSGLEH